jgi:beta-1,4-galactosyltransferase 1
MVNNKKLALIVPFSNRLEQMYTFIGHFEYFLKDKVEYEIHFIEQEDASDFFNYGKLCNVGVDIVKNDADYFVFHDIDILPKQEMCNYEYDYYPTHLCPNLKPYPHWIGGAFKISKQDFITVNGFSNDYWGGTFHWNDFLYRLNKHNLLLTKRFFTKNIYKPHTLTDVKEANKYIKKTIYPFISNNDNCAMIKSNKTTDYIFEDSYTISLNVFINDDQSSNATIIGKQGHDMGLFVMKNEAIVVQIWNDMDSLYQIWYPHKIHSNQWINLTLRVDCDKQLINLFVDGKLVGSENFKGNLKDYKGKDLWIGSLAFKDCFNGKLSNLNIFDYALTNSEIVKLYTDGYRDDNEQIQTNFPALISINFDKKFGDFYVDESNSFSNARVVTTGLYQELYSESLNLSYEFNMPEQSIGRFEVLENSKKFTKLDNYNWKRKDDDFAENENMFFYEIASGVLDTDKFGLNTLSYKIVETEEIKNKVYKHRIKF